MPSRAGQQEEPADPQRTADGLDEATLRQRLFGSEAELETLRAQVQGSEWLAERISHNEHELSSLRAEVESLRARPLLRYVDRLQGEVGRVRRRLRRVVPSAGGGSGGLAQPETGPVVEPSASFPEDGRYSTWVAAYDTIDDEARTSIRGRLESLTDRPLVSIILPVFNSPEPYLRAAIQSVQSQIYTNWELCIADDCSTAAWVPKVLDEYAAADSRIKVRRRSVNGHISEASNTAVEMATGTWLALFDHDDVYPEHALAVAVLALADVPDAGILYSDEDHIDDDGNRSGAYFKPDFDPVLLLGQNYFSHLCMVRRDLVRDAGGFRVGYEGSQDWDLVLRVVERLDAHQVVHVPHVLYHWRVHEASTASSIGAKPYAAVAARRSVADHLERTGKRGKVVPVGGSGFTRVRWDLPDEPPEVSVVVVPRSGERLVRCIDSARVRAAYPSVEMVVVDDGDQRPLVRGFLRDRQDSITVVRDDRHVNDGALRNAGARAASGELLCFLHDDVEAITDGWLEEMVGLLLQPGIGAVGAKLLYPEGTVEHAGMVMGIGGTVGHVHRFTDALAPGYFGRAMLSQCFSAVSWACMLVRRDAFDAVGGFDEVRLSGAFLDVDLCLRLGEAGWRVAWTPHAELTHFEPPDEWRVTAGENAVRLAREVRYLHVRWADVLARDPAYNPNLSLAHETCPLAWPPRATYR